MEEEQSVDMRRRTLEILDNTLVLRALEDEDDITFRGGGRVLQGLWDESFK